MGASASRISTADFVTPPELCDRRLAAEGAGRIGGLRLELTCDVAATRLTGCYQQVPLRVLPAFQFGPGQPALLYLLNPTAGLMDGDAQLVCVRAASGTRTVLVGQSATRIHPSLRGFSTQQWHIRVESGAVLVVLPGPAIPFQDSRYYQRVDIDLEAGASLVWGDIWLAGRYAHPKKGPVPLRIEGQAPFSGEQFQFATLIQELTVRRDQVTVFRDRFCWQGPWDRARAAWHFGTAPACGSLFVTGPVQEQALHAAGETLGALFPTAQGDTCMRCSGDSEKVTAHIVKTALYLGAGLAGNPPDKPWLPPGRDLAPNHWFTSHLPEAYAERHAPAAPAVRDLAAGGRAPAG